MNKIKLAVSNFLLNPKYLVIDLVLLIAISAFVLGWINGYGYSERNTTNQRVDIVKQNTEIITSLGGAAATQSYLSDLLVRVSHYTDGHKKGNHIMCMECEGTESKIDNVVIGGEETKASHKQIMSDLIEIETSIDSLTFGNLHQIKKLEMMLKRQREKSMLDNVKFFGG